MKMVKGLLLGTATGLVALTGAQAADLPVKAAPVQYVKICSLYGAGFYYIPGTDTCLKIGGWVRAEYNIYANGSFAPIINGSRALHNRNSQEINSRARGIISFDARTQTEYGTLRSYIEGGWQSDNGATPTAATAVYRFFVQLAGFTAGFTQSFFDAYPVGKYSNETAILGSDTGGNGTTAFAYTAQFGNGLSATLSLEQNDVRRNTIINSDLSGFSATGDFGGPSFAQGGTGAGASDAYANSEFPDLVANVRVDQAWGNAQIMGALHEVRANYFGTLETSGHPDDELGWAVGAGVTVNLPVLGQGDSFSIQADYAEGATRYNFTGINNNGFAVYDGDTVGFGIASDAVYSGALGSSLELTKSWSVQAGIDHHWLPNLTSSLYGAYGKVDYNDVATALLNDRFFGATPVVGSPDFSFWQAGSRTVWSPVKNLDLSIDVMYNHLDSSYDGSLFSLAPGGGKPTAVYALSSQTWWQGIFRVQRNFYP